MGSPDADAQDAEGGGPGPEMRVERVHRDDRLLLLFSWGDDSEQAE